MFRRTLPQTQRFQSGAAHDKCSKALQKNPPDSRYIVFYTKDQRPKMSNKPEERDESQGGHRARAYTKHKHKPLTPEAILLEEVSMLGQKSDLRAETGLVKDLKTAHYVRKSLASNFSFSVFIRIFLYHLFFPLTIPFVIVFEGLHLAHAMQFMVCLEPGESSNDKSIPWSSFLSPGLLEPGDSMRVRNRPIPLGVVRRVR